MTKSPRTFALALYTAACIGCSHEDSSRQPSGQAPGAAPRGQEDTAIAQPVTDSLPGSWCVPRTVASLAGIATYSPVESVQAVLGVPLRRDSGRGEDDGGVYRTTILRFAHVAVHIDDRGYGVERVEALDTTVALPGNIRLGMLLSEAQDRLAAPQVDRALEERSNHEVWIASVCGEGDAPHLYPSETESIYFYINEAKRLSGIALTNYGP